MKSEEGSQEEEVRRRKARGGSQSMAEYLRGTDEFRHDG